MKGVVLSDGVLHWRIEGKAIVGGVTTTLFGPTRSAYFDMGNITGLTVSPSHIVDGKDGVWPVNVSLPTFSWDNGAPNAVKFFVDVSSDPNVPLSDKALTVTLGGKGVPATSYPLTAADWKKVRQLASKGEGVVYWRVRGTDEDGLLECGSAVAPLVIDGGTLDLAPFSLSDSPCKATWTHDTGPVTYRYYLQVSMSNTFDRKDGWIIKRPATSIDALSYTLTDKETASLRKKCVREAITELYVRVSAEDPDKAFVVRSDAVTVPVL
jgi:hypothetical protein